MATPSQGIQEPTPPNQSHSILGRRREVRVVRFHADDADGLVRALDRTRL
ncbi:hypothetical protein ACIQUU_15015 [Streptomyces sp. NPDC101116]